MLQNVRTGNVETKTSESKHITITNLNQVLHPAIILIIVIILMEEAHQMLLSRFVECNAKRLQDGELDSDSQRLHHCSQVW